MLSTLFLHKTLSAKLPTHLRPISPEEINECKKVLVYNANIVTFLISYIHVYFCLIKEFTSYVHHMFHFSAKIKPSFIVQELSINP